MSTLPCFYHFAAARRSYWPSCFQTWDELPPPKMQDNIVMFLVDTGIMGGWSNIQPENHHPSTTTPHPKPPYFFSIPATSWGNQSTHCKIIQVYQLRNAILENSTATTKKRPEKQKTNFWAPHSMGFKTHLPTGKKNGQDTGGLFLYGRNILWCFNWEGVTQHLGDVR